MFSRIFLFSFFVLFSRSTGQSIGEKDQQIDLSYVKYNTIEGKIFFPYELPYSSNWITETRIVVNYGAYFAFIRRDGTFVVNNLPPGSYIVDVTNPNYIFEPIRVDINSKGKLRARKVNLIQTNIVQAQPYPLRFKPKMPFKYFQIRESWRITDFLFNPMVLMMVLPLLLIMGLSKTVNMNDAETQKELQSIQMPKYDMPELSEMMTSFFNPSQSKQNTSNQLESKKSSKSSKKKN